MKLKLFRNGCVSRSEACAERMGVRPMPLLALGFAGATSAAVVAPLPVNTPAQAQASAALELPRVHIASQAEQADGPVQGYRARQSASFTRIPMALREVPASVSVIGSQQMQDQGLHSLADVLAQVPGASAHQGEGNRDQMILRGINSSADFFIDGVRDDAQVFRDLYNLERVEVLCGPAGMAFGRGGAGGVLNRVSKRPQFRAAAEAMLGWDAFGGWRTRVDVNDHDGRQAAWRLNAMAERERSFRDGVHAQRRAANPVGLWRLNGSIAGTGTLVLGVEALDDRRTADRGQPSQNGRPVQAPVSRFFGNSAQSQSRIGVRGGYAVLEVSGHEWAFKNTLRFTHYDKFYQNVYADGAPSSSVSPSGTLRLAAYNQANQRTNVFNQTDFTRSLAWGPTRHEWLAGVEWGRQDSRNQRNTGYFGVDKLATVSVQSPWAEATRFEPAATDTRNRVSATLWAAYAQDQITLDPQWKLLAGLRHDRFTVEVDDLRPGGVANDLRRSDALWSRRLGLVWLPSAQTSAYLSLSDAALPSGETLSLAPNTADLAPETAVNRELGARWDVRPELTLSAALFQLDRLHVRSPDSLNPGFFVKTGQQRTEGAELALQGQVQPGWHVAATWSRLNGRIAKTTAAAPAGARLAGVAPLQGSLWSRFDCSPAWAVGLGLVGQGARFAALDNRVTLAGYVRADATLSYRPGADGLGAGTRWMLQVENLGRIRYWPVADNNNNISPGAPQMWRLSVQQAL